MISFVLFAIFENFIRPREFIMSRLGTAFFASNPLQEDPPEGSAKGPPEDRHVGMLRDVYSTRT